MTMEFCSHGDLIELMIKRGAIKDEMLLRYLIAQICQGVDALHTTAGYAHLDLKPDNILIGDDYRLKVCDFGSLQPVSKELSTRYGTPGYQAPEIFTS